MAKRKQGLLFDYVQGGVARDAAIGQVDDNAPPDCKAVILATIARVAGQLDTFTTDDVWAEVPASVRHQVEPRVMGAMMIRATRAGLVAKLPGVFRPSAMVRCHRRPKQVWKGNAHAVPQDA